jgi:NAD-dependent dihydropyrimidine dehydrogenase PreA subunit
MSVTRKIIEIDEELCNGCGECIITCAEGALALVDGKAKLIADKFCDGLGACLGPCPTGALRIIERAADEFDEIAVEHHLAGQKPADKPAEPLPCGCPSAQLRTFSPVRPVAAPRPPQHGAQASDVSALGHWPVQIKLVPPTAPFLKGADLLVAADCTPVAYPAFHRDFLSGKVVMIGCPKFDDMQLYLDKFTQIFSSAGIKTVTVVVMEVPCCQSMPLLLGRAMEAAGVSVPMEQVTISVRGEVLSTERLVA